MKCLVTILAVCLMPAALWASPGEISVSTGVRGTHSSQYIVWSDPAHTVLAEARILYHGANQVFIIELANQSSTGHRLRVTGVSRGMSTLDFDPAFRTEAFCNGAGACDGTRIGTIFLNQRVFERAMEQGMPVRLNGPDGRFEFTLPPTLFSEAHGLADWLN